VESGAARRWAATSAIAAAALYLVGFAYHVLVLPRLPSDPGPGGPLTPAPGELAPWLQLPMALAVRLLAGIPLAGAALLLHRREERRPIGAGVVGAFALPVALTVPSHFVFFTFAGETVAVVSQILNLGYGVAAAAALVFVGITLAQDRTVGWTDPRRGDQATLRLVLLGAVVLIAVVHLAQPLTSQDGGPPWAWGVVLGGIMPAWIFQQFAFAVLPLVGVLAIGVAAAGARPARVGAAAAAVLSVHEVVGVVGMPISVVMMEQAWGHQQQLTIWYWMQVAVVVVLVVSVVLLWRHGRQSDIRRRENGNSGRCATA
jgi:hypothetical protein